MTQYAEFLPAMVAMAHDAGNPFRIDDAGTHDAGDFFFQGPDFRRFGPRMIVVIDRWAAAAQAFDGRTQAAFKLIIIV